MLVEIELSEEAVAVLRGMGARTTPREFAERLVAKGLEAMRLPVATKDDQRPAWSLTVAELARAVGYEDLQAARAASLASAEFNQAAREAAQELFRDVKDLAIRGPVVYFDSLAHLRSFVETGLDHRQCFRPGSRVVMALGVSHQRQPIQAIPLNPRGGGGPKGPN